MILLRNIKIAPGEQCKSSVINYNNRVEVFLISSLVQIAGLRHCVCDYVLFVKDFPSLQEWTGFFNTLPP